MVVMRLVAEALTSISEEFVTEALSSMKASVVAMMTGVAAAVPVVPSDVAFAVVATAVFVAASMVTEPAALIVALSDTALRAVVTMNGAATAI